MNMQSKKLNIIQQILQINDNLLLETLQNIIDFGLQRQEGKSEAVADFWEELSEEQKENVKTSLKQLDEGKGIPHDEVMEELRKKYKR